jgi:hypothetical protein
MRTAGAKVEFVCLCPPVNDSTNLGGVQVDPGASRRNCSAAMLPTKRVSPELIQGSRHCEEQSDEAIQVLFLDCFALRFAVDAQ